MLTTQQIRDFDEIASQQCSVCKFEKKCPIKKALSQERGGGSKYNVHIAIQMVDGSDCRSFQPKRSSL